MKSNYLLMASMVLIVSAYAQAESKIVDVWQCQLKEGKTMKDVSKANDKWVKFMNANVKGGGINSYDLEPRVGDHNGFLYVDVYPNMQSWAAGEKIMEGKALEKELRMVAKCSSNNLYSSTKH